MKRSSVFHGCWSAVNALTFLALCSSTCAQLAHAQTYTTLYSFGVGSSGYVPEAGVIRDSAGNLYGTTYAGGNYDVGTVYELDTNGQFNLLYSFSGASGAYPAANLIEDSAGNIYGTTLGALSGPGVIFKLDTATNQETTLNTFTRSDGANPQSSLVRDSEGNLYGTTIFGGTSGYGVVFELNTAGELTVLYNFTGGTDGGKPNGIIRLPNGDLIGTAATGGTSGYGVVFELNTLGQESVLHNFTGGIDGAGPSSGVIGDSAGNLYGTTLNGGAAGFGIVFKLDTAGKETVLHSFAGGSDGAKPCGELVRDAAGNFYGATVQGGASNAGVIFTVGPTGEESVLYTFTGGADGGNPLGGVIRDSAGNLYGTASTGGLNLWGAIFELEP